MMKTLYEIECILAQGGCIVLVVLVGFMGVNDGSESIFPIICV